MNNIHTEELKRFYKAVLSLESEEDCIAFFEDICTIKELKDISQRLQVAKMLSEGIVYSVIAAQTGLSTATISRVNHCLKYGSEGYLKVLDRMKLEEKKSLKK